MRGIIMVATVALVMAAMWVAMAMPAFADGRGGGQRWLRRRRQGQQL